MSSSPLIDNQVYIIVLDIEGTTTPLEFVYKTLFLYANRKFESFLREHFREPEVESLIQQLYSQHQTDERQGLQPSAWIDDEHDESWMRSCVEYCRWLMARDSKYTPLKSLQGKIWQEGYALGELHGQVYADVPPAFNRWRLQKREICIYSSGSVLAQQLLFRSTSYGDLTPLISAFFDTRIGAKTETESYRKIAQALTHNPRDSLFISDAVKEVRAASDAGMQAIICNRDVQAPQPEETKTVIHSFDEVFPG
ncbi:MAG TPA: acireductone synthase [Candidatus Bathyarchaeia archaeon]|nr:acireductone synthase [Candidatus Bathyarchaeia archaeon]